jgi:hypothetical protein
LYERFTNRIKRGVNKLNNYIECKTQQELEVCCKNYDIAIVRNGIFTARENSQVTAWGNSQVTARGNSQVTARENSQVTAYNYSMVRACDYSVVKASGYNALTQNGDNAKITKSKNCTLIKVPDKVTSLKEYMDFYPCKVTDTAIYLYKAVKKDLKAFYDGVTQYPVKGKISTDVLSPSSSGSCAKGLHFSHFDWAVNLGQSSGKFVILKARIPKINPQTKKENIVVSEDCDGKLRCQYAEIVEVIKDWQHYQDK